MNNSFVIMCGSRGGGVGPDPPHGKSQNIGFLSNTGPDPEKSQIYQASIQSWAIIGKPAKRRFASGPILARFSWYLDPPSTKK